MATIQATVTRIDENTVRFRWTGLTQATADDGVPIGANWADYPDRSVQVEGTFGAGGNLRVEGSNDEAVYAALNDPFGAALNITAASLRGITEVPLLTRPRVIAGDGTTNLNVTILARRPRSGLEV